MKIHLGLLASAIALTGCANEALNSEQLALIQQQQSKKTLEFSCDGPCSLSYKDPRDKLTLPKHTNGYDVANTLLQTAGSVALGTAPWAAVSKIASDGYNRAGGTYSNSYNQTTDSTHTPAVVTAPDPVVVPSPDPVVVPSPDPVIVNAPAPIIVNTPTSP